MARKLVLLLALGLLMGLLLPLQAARAQAGPTVTDGGVDNKFPEGMVFHVSAQGASPIQQIRLHYTIQPDGTSAIAEPEFQAGTSVTTTLQLEGNNPPKIYLPPGTRVEYHWEATDAAGNTGQSPDKTFVYDDTRFQWKDVSSSGVTVHSYSGSTADAQKMLSVAAETFTRMTQLLGAKIDFPVSVWTYDSESDMRPALARRSATYDQSVITEGVRVSSDTVLVLGNVSFDTLRHELTHVVTAQAGESALGSLPAWLDEGTAVYAQQDAGPFRDAIEGAIQDNDVLSVQSISSYPGDPQKVNLFYGEAWSLVKYLNDTYGPQKFAALFAAIKSGKRIDSALQAVYGFDQNGLDNKWRAANRLPPRPTVAPTQASQASAAPSGQTQSEGGGTSVGTVAAIAVGAVVLAGLVGALGWTVRRRFG